MVDIILDLSCSAQLIMGKDKNGENPIHLSCYHTNIKITLKLLRKGATFYCRNIYDKDPIDIIPNYVKRKAFLRILATKRSKLAHKELDCIKEHLDRCEYLESLAEIIYATQNRHQFKIDKGLVIKHDLGAIANRRRNRANHIESLKEFKLGFRTKEEFYDGSLKRAKKKVIIEDLGNEKENLTAMLNASRRPNGMESYFSPAAYEFNELPVSFREDQENMMMTDGGMLGMNDGNYEPIFEEDGEDEYGETGLGSVFKKTDDGINFPKNVK